MVEGKAWWQTKDFDFVRIPKELFRNPYYGDLSSESKLLYGFLLDRASLSQTQGEKWRTPEGDPFAIFTLAEIQQRLNCSKPKAINLLSSLQEHNLIQRSRPKKDGPYHIVVKPFGTGVINFDLPKSKNVTCAGKKMLPGQVKKFDLNNTDRNNTEKNNTDKITLLERDIQLHIDYEYLVTQYPRKQVDAIVEVMVQTLASQAKTITVNGVPLDAQVVHTYLRKAEVMRIQYIFDHMESQTTPIHAYRAYFLARLCDPEGVVDAFYDELHRSSFM